MREILFRGKNLLTGAWVYGDLLNVGVDYDYAIRTYGGREHGQVNAVNENTVGQFTGLTDRNGKKIFEGDFVKEQDIVHNGEIQIPGHIFSVVMRKGCWCVIPIYDTEEWDFLNSYLPFLEVIGNIHDNPELMEVTE